MKKIVTATSLLLALLLIVPFSTLQAQDNKSKNYSQVLFSVEIDCASCKQKLESQLPFVKGVKDLKIDIDNQTVWFLYDNRKTNKENLVAALEKLGYGAKEIEQPEERAKGDKR